MIIKFKIYEQSSYSLKRVFENNKNPEIGDWAIFNIDIDDMEYIECKEFILNNIGQIIKRGGKDDLPQFPDVKQYNFDFTVKFNNVPNNYPFGEYFNKNGEIGVYLDELLFYSSNKEEVEAYLNSLKYNL